MAWPLTAWPGCKGLIFSSDPPRACASTNFTSNSLRTGTWQYGLGGTPGTWSAGVYTNVVTYTATGV